METETTSTEGTGTEGATGLEGVTYAEAARELETILAELESDRLDVDEVVARVKRSSDLIQLCRDKVNAAQIQVRKVVTELE